MFHELRAAILPTLGLNRTLRDWPTIVDRLADSKRKRCRQSRGSLS
jgi:hypothetical protein